MNGRTSVLDLARGIGDKNDVGGLLGESAEALFALAEGVAFGFVQLADVLLSLEPEKKYQDGGRCQYCGRQQFVSSSQRNTLGPFVPVNCCAVSPELAESVLFGHVRGAFTGATSDIKGCFDMADKG